MYHLVAGTPVQVCEIKEVAADLLRIDGVRWAGAEVLRHQTPLEEAFLGHLREYIPYLSGDPVFHNRNTRAALPWLPAPRVDRALLARLIRFAVAHNWGRSRGRNPSRSIDCAPYVERFFPQAVRRSTLARVPVDVTVGLEVSGTGGGRWSFRCADGDILWLRRWARAGADVVYRMDVPSFQEIVSGRRTPHHAFLARCIEVEGDLEKALKLAVLFGQFVQECPYTPDPDAEATDATPLSA
jgi:hypothetical protein